MIHDYHYIPGTSPTGIPLVLLHGSGGTEQELIPLATKLAPGSPMLGIRGTVAIDGGFAFFHRRPDRSIDEADISSRLPVLAEFMSGACVRHEFCKAPIAVGFSNGAIMAAALLLTHPALLSGAMLLRPLSPFIQDSPARLDGTPVLIIDGEKDTRRSPGDGARLAERLARAGAIVTHRVLPVGHSITSIDEHIAKEWCGNLDQRVTVSD
jgi:phospholipase/carboxylesterase